MKILGILIILNSLVLAGWWITSYETNKTAVLAICSIAVFVGFALTFQDRITELTVKGVGTIKAATQQAESDAKAIAELRERVENQSATIDLIASEATTAKKISEEVADKNQRAEVKLETLDLAISKANSVLDDLDEVSEFTMTVVAAQNDDRIAYDKIQEWAKNNNYRFSSEADQAWIAIYESHNNQMYTKGDVPWDAGVDPSKFSLSDLDRQYQSLHVQLKPNFLEYIWTRNDISEFDRLEFMINVIKTDPSLKAVEYAGRIFARGTKQGIKALSVDHFLEWWELHKDELGGK